MKKFMILISAALLIAAGTIIFCFAAYNYSSPPTDPTDWDFTASRQYTIASKIDLIYTKGTKGFLGIGRKLTSATVNVKAVQYYYSYGMVGIQDADGTYFYNPLPSNSSSNTAFSQTLSGSTTEAARFVRYEGETYQMDEYISINRDYYYYNSQTCTIQHLTN